MPATRSALSLSATLVLYSVISSSGAPFNPLTLIRGKGAGPVAAKQVAAKADAPKLPLHDRLHARFHASGFDEASQLWRDSGAHGFIGRRIAGEKLAIQKDGAIAYVGGASDTSLSFGLIVPQGDFTLCSTTRYGASDDNRGTVLVGSDEEWFHGHHGGRAGVRRYGRSDSRHVQPAASGEWLVLCGHSTKGAVGNQELIVNDGIMGRKNPSGWAVADVAVWDFVLTAEQLAAVEAHMTQRYLPEALAQVQPTYLDALDPSLQKALDAFTRGEMEQEQALSRGGNSPPPADYD